MYLFGTAFAEESKKEKEISAEISRISAELKTPAFINGENFPEKLLEHRKSAKTYIAEFEMFCRRGVRKQLNEQKKFVRKRMSREERKACFQKLKDESKKLIETLYQAQKSYLAIGHSKELQALDQSFKINIDELESAYSRYLK